MAGHGPARKAVAARRGSRNGPESLPNTGRTAPKLPDPRPYGIAGGWHSFVGSWWRSWWTSPMAAFFTDVDARRLEMLLPLVHSYMTDPKPAVMAEIRMNESKLGATAEDRKRLEWTIEEPPAPQPARTKRDLRLVDDGSP